VRTRAVSILFLLVAAALPLAAQSAPAPGTGAVPGPGPVPGKAPAPATNPALVPGEPEIVMPQVILKIEDLSVESVEAQLPPEEDLLPPVRTVPILSEGELAVGEPVIPMGPVVTEGPVQPSGNRLLSSDVQLAAGSLGLISGSVSLKTLGPDPRFSLQFNHETLDGFGGNKPGAGFNSRTDGLNGGLKFAIGGVSTELSGSFKEDENGLQGLPSAGSYSSALSRTITGGASFSGTIDWLTLTATGAGGLDSLTMQGATPSPSSEIRFAPSLTAQAKFGAVKVGLETDYWYRHDDYLAGGQDFLHRLKVAPTLRIDLPANFVVQGSVGWFVNSAGLSRFPFFVSLTGTPLDFLTISLEGGYKVVPYDAHDILAANDLAQPTPLVDDRGWYGASSAQLSLTRDLSATVKASFLSSDAMPIGSTKLDPATGLFDVTQGPGVQLSLNSGLRWGITQYISVSAGWDHEFLDRPYFLPLDSLTGGILGLDPSGRFGGGVTVAFGPIADGTLQQPLLHASAFWKIIEAVKLQLDADDLLAPLSGNRWNVSRDTYLAPGFRLSLSLGMSL
jgi:hypothetical protein